MNKLVFILFFFLIGNTVFSQDRSSLKKRKQLSSNVNSNRLDMDSLSSRSSKQAVKNDKAKIQDYLIITQKNDTIQVDTILSIYKDYKFNFLRQNYNILGILKN